VQPALAEASSTPLTSRPHTPCPAGKGGGPDLSLVECGQAFYLEVQALDQFGNK
jgi:hypothetical protein